MVYLFMAKGTEELEYITVADVLRRAGIEVVTVSVEDSQFVEGAHSIVIKTDISLDECDIDKCDMIVIPGGMGGVTSLLGCSKAGEMIKRFAEENRPLAAICAGPMVLAANGALNNHRATIYPGLEAYLEEGGAVCADEKVVADGNTVTSQGPGTAMDFAFALVEFLKSEEASEEVKEGMLVNL